jgi:hypothetical protein
VPYALEHWNEFVINPEGSVKLTSTGRPVMRENKQIKHQREVMSDNISLLDSDYVRENMSELVSFLKDTEVGNLHMNEKQIQPNLRDFMRIILQPR